MDAKKCLSELIEILVCNSGYLGRGGKPGRTGSGCQSTGRTVDSG